MGPTGKTRIVQIHPTRKCNLSCRHCYSSSSPKETEIIEPALLKQAMTDLAHEGYEWTTFSGGEPLVYEALPELLDHGRKNHMRTSLVSNGMLLNGSRLQAIEGKFDALVMSLDGKPASHNRMRNSARAFQGMARNLSGLHQRGISFGFLFTLTQNNLDELPWVVNFCLEAGARGLLIHPLENTGNAAAQLTGKSPDALETAHAWALVEHYKRTVAGRLNIHLDLVHRQALELYPDQFFLGPSDIPLKGRLADLLSVLVIEPDGEVVPLQYGFPRRYSLGNLRECRIRDMAEGWRQRTGPEVHRLSIGLHESLEADNDTGFINWYERLNQYARRSHTVTIPIEGLSQGSAVAGAA
ncbi:radical SAM/SPASM domain-containing protein [Granulosicoccus sp. 3-233]|uniref:radical SAM protein n=1 Tax=Granulosicoccus sp. 3-233 TaxID=3417969 RepID=UPI003D344904